jgi:hypothetical protein
LNIQGLAGLFFTLTLMYTIYKIHKHTEQTSDKIMEMCYDKHDEMIKYKEKTTWERLTFQTTLS